MVTLRVVLLFLFAVQLCTTKDSDRDGQGIYVSHLIVIEV